jgi:hypothetical protein
MNGGSFAKQDTKLNIIHTKYFKNSTAIKFKYKWQYVRKCLEYNM